jgi:lysozyme family protein
MTSDRFHRLVKIILEHEGGYVWDDNDAGGETNYGISKRSYPDLDIKNLTKEKATAIYQFDYWSDHFDNILSDRVALMLFDFGVNAGPTRAARLIQHIVGTVADGMVGPMTIKAINDYHQVRLVRDYGVRLALYYTSLGQESFVAGWLKRLMDNMTREI